MDRFKTYTGSDDAEYINRRQRDHEARLEAKRESELEERTIARLFGDEK